MQIANHCVKVTLLLSHTLSVKEEVRAVPCGQT